jgi:hypothetical protein
MYCSRAVPCFERCRPLSTRRWSPQIRQRTKSKPSPSLKLRLRPESCFGCIAGRFTVSQTRSSWSQRFSLRKFSSTSRPATRKIAPRADPGDSDSRRPCGCGGSHRNQGHRRVGTQVELWRGEALDRKRAELYD